MEDGFQRLVRDNQEWDNKRLGKWQKSRVWQSILNLDAGAAAAGTVVFGVFPVESPGEVPLSGRPADKVFCRRVRDT